MHHSSVYSQFAAFTFCLSFLSQTALAEKVDETRTGRPNIIFIMADDLGYGDLGCYGQQRVKTPHIDRLAAEGLKFSQFYAGSTVCAPSRCVLMTGLHTGHCYIRGNAKTNLRPDDVTVAEILHQAGYTTGLFGKWGLGHEGSSGLPTRQGFDAFFGYLDQSHAHNYYPQYLVKNETRFPLRNLVPNPGRHGQGVATEKLDYSADFITREALSFIDANHQRPFFLYFASTLPHANNEARGKGMEIPAYGRYADKEWPEPQKGLAAMIDHLDRGVGQIMDRLKLHGIDDNTIVFFTSDNGPHREGGNDPDFFDSNGALRGIKRALYEGGIRVPLLVRWPGRIKPATTSDQIGDFSDFLPTAAALAGVESPPQRTDGLSLVPTLMNQPQKQRQHDYLYWEFYEQGSRQAVRLGDWKGIRQPMLTGKIELYNLKNDLSESNDVAARHPEIVAQVRAALDEAHTPSPLWKPRGQRRSRKAKK